MGGYRKYSELNAFVPPSDDVESGSIIIWSGSIATIPAGYVLCDGNNGTPDLRDRFVVGAKQDVAGVAKSNITGALLQSQDVKTHVHTTSGVFTAADVGADWPTIDTAQHIPPFFALAYIMKT
jgi:hypothetical protein